MLTKELADTLCTVIAVGFIYDNEIKTSGSKTKFIYEQETDSEKHDNLSNRLIPYSVRVTFEKQTPKLKQPLIVAKTKYINSTEQIEGIPEESMKFYQSCEAALNVLISKGEFVLAGAYIGGLATLSGIKFIGPSYLRLYSPEYRESDSIIESSYNNAKNVSNELITFLKTKTTFEEPPIPIAPYESGKLFASCHGMIRAICKYLPTKTDVWVELALGKDTSKVASCLPCSLFMSSNGTPASATHLGRGDNWNLPAYGDITHKGKVAKWREKTIEVYYIGLDKMGRNIKVCKLKEWLEGNFELSDIAKKIPDIFLESLTFEGSFTEKMQSILS